MSPAAVSPSSSPSITAMVDTLERELADLEPGALVASEHELMKRFGATRSAVRGVLRILEQTYRVRRVQGRGTFVNRRIDYLISRTAAPSLHKTVETAGGTCRTLLVDNGLGQLPEVGAGVTFADADDAQRLGRLSYVNGLPAVYLDEWIPHEVCAHVEIAVGAVHSVHETLRGCGFEPVRTWCQVSTVLPPGSVPTAR